MGTWCERSEMSSSRSVATMSESIDTQQLAIDELMAQAVPDPTMLLEVLSPFTQLYYAEQVAYYVLKAFTVGVVSDTDTELDAESGPVKALMALSMACGNLDAACIELGILPAEAAG